jgi:hypothetical protein
MKTLRLLLSGVVFFGLVTATLRSEPSAAIKVGLDRKIAQIDPTSYGAFVELIRSIHWFMREILGGETNIPSVMSRGPAIDEKMEIVEALIKKASVTASPRIPSHRCGFQLNSWAILVDVSKIT